MALVGWRVTCAALVGRGVICTVLIGWGVTCVALIGWDVTCAALIAWGTTCSYHGKGLSESVHILPLLHGGLTKSYVAQRTIRFILTDEEDSTH